MPNAEDVIPRRWSQTVVLFDNGVYSVIIGLYRSTDDHQVDERDHVYGTSRGCSHRMMLCRESGTSILVDVPPELLPAACGESQPAYGQYGNRPPVLPTRARFA